MKTIISFFIGALLMQISDSFWGNLSSIIGSIGVIVVGVLSAVLNYKLNVLNKKVVTVDEKLSTVHEEVIVVKDDVKKVAVEVDGKMAQMLKLSQDKFFAEGVKEAVDARKEVDAAKNEGELKAMKDAELLKTPPKQ